MRSSSFTPYVLLLSFAPLSAQQIRNPKASLVDIHAQQALLKAKPQLAQGIGNRSCVSLPVIAAPQGHFVIPRHYLTGSNGPTNPAEAEATKPYNDLEGRVSAGTNQWIATGNEKEAQCVLAQLDLWAQAKTLIDYDPKESSQAWFQVEWTLSSLGVADSVLVNDAKLDRAVQARVTAWLDDAATHMMSFDKPNGNNHHYWRGLAAASIGIAANDSKLYAAGVQAYKDGIAEIDERGALPQEMARHENAIHYQSFALQPLCLIAQLASRQGEDLYAYAVHGRTIRDAIVFLGKAAADPSLVLPYTQDAQHGSFSAGDFAAEAFYVARFSAAGLPANVASSLTHDAWQTRIGGDTLVFVPR